VQDEGNRRIRSCVLPAEQSAEAVDTEFPKGAGLGEGGAVVQADQPESKAKAVSATLGLPGSSFTRLR
jgi:hypothetical protein